jgi:hypothetical protein
MNEHPIGLEMLWNGAAGHQLKFVRDRLTALVGMGLDYEDRKDITTVISTHGSKSIDLPVYQLARGDLGLRLILRDNFYNWKLSVLSETPIKADFSCLFHTTSPVAPAYTGNPLSSVYFEGFPSDLVFGYYDESDGRRWSAEIGDDYTLWMVVHAVMRSLGVVKPLTWHTEASHRAELDAETERWKAREAKRRVA